MGYFGDFGGHFGDFGDFDGDFGDFGKKKHRRRLRML